MGVEKLHGIVRMHIVLIYDYIPTIGMAENESECALSDMQIVIAYSILTSLSLLSLIIGLISLTLKGYNYFCRKGQHHINPVDGILLMSTILGCTVELCDCLQWFVLQHLDSFIGCEVLVAVSIYASMGLLITIACLGTHLLILTTQPKCLRVINEEKLKRFNILRRTYILAIFLVPIFLMPSWSIAIIQKEGVCFSLNSSCDTSLTSHNLPNYLDNVFNVLAILVWLFTMVVFGVISYRHCAYRRISLSKWKPDFLTIIALLTTFIVLIIVLFMLQYIKRDAFYPSVVMTVMVLPLILIVNFIISICRQVNIIRARRNEIVMDVHKSVVEQSDRDYNAASSTYFSLPKDEWDT